MRILEFNNKNFYNELKIHLFKKNQKNNLKIEKSVQTILKEVESHGDKALIKYTKEFDKIELKIDELLLNEEIRNSFKNKIIVKQITFRRHDYIYIYGCLKSRSSRILRIW